MHDLRSLVIDEVMEDTQFRLRHLELLPSLVNA